MGLYIVFFPQLIPDRSFAITTLPTSSSTAWSPRGLRARAIRAVPIASARRSLIANTVAVPADRSSALPTSALNAGLAWLGIVCYTLQIYFDFLGLSDMAIGLARSSASAPGELHYPYIARS